MAGTAHRHQAVGMSSALYWVPGPSNAVLTEPWLPPSHTSGCRGRSLGREYIGRSTFSGSTGSWGRSATAVCPYPTAPVRPQQPEPPWVGKRGCLGLQHRKLASHQHLFLLKMGQGAAHKLYQGQW